MDRTDAVAWLLSACAVSLRYSQAKTLLALVRAAMATPRISLASLGRSAAGAGRAKHRIKRVWRFIANPRVEPTLAMSPVIQRLLALWPRRKPLLVSFDWTDLRGLQTLVAAANVKRGGRSRWPGPVAASPSTTATAAVMRSRNPCC